MTMFERHKSKLANGLIDTGGPEPSRSTTELGGGSTVQAPIAASVPPIAASEQHPPAPDQHLPRSPCPTCGGIVWEIPLYDQRPIDQAEYRCLDCHPSAARAPRRRVMLFAGDGPDSPPVAVQVGRDLRPIDLPDAGPVSAGPPPANQGSGGEPTAATAATSERQTERQAERQFDLRDWRSWETPDGLAVIHSRAWHQRGTIGGIGRLPDHDETLDQWFSRLRILTDGRG